MKFIKIHTAESNVEILVSIDRIISISECDDDTCFIEVYVDSKDNSIGYYTVELYSEIKFQLLNNK